jgi:hypothetical protein
VIAQTLNVIHADYGRAASRAAPRAPTTGYWYGAIGVCGAGTDFGLHARNRAAVCELGLDPAVPILVTPRRSRNATPISS